MTRNFRKVASGNMSEDVEFSNGITMKAGPINLYADDDEDYDFPSALSAYERGEHPCPPLGGCRTCGCPPEAMPMINRGTGWCSENHRKEQLKEDER